MEVRIEKLKTDIEKTKEKITEFQTKLRSLEQQKTELENRRIIEIVRGEKISDAQLTEFIKSLDGGKESKPAEVAEAAEVKKPTIIKEELSIEKNNQN